MSSRDEDHWASRSGYSARQRLKARKAAERAGEELPAWAAPQQRPQRPPPAAGCAEAPSERQVVPWHGPITFGAPAARMPREYASLHVLCNKGHKQRLHGGRAPQLARLRDMAACLKGFFLWEP